MTRLLVIAATVLTLLAMQTSYLFAGDSYKARFRGTVATVTDGGLRCLEGVNNGEINIGGAVNVNLKNGVHGGVTFECKDKDSGAFLGSGSGKVLSAPIKGGETLTIVVLIEEVSNTLLHPPLGGKILVEIDNSAGAKTIAITVKKADGSDVGTGEGSVKRFTCNGC